MHSVHLDDGIPVIPFHPSLSHCVVYPAELQLYRRMALLGQCPKRRLAKEEANGIRWRICELRSVTNRGILRSTPELKIEDDLYVLVVGRLRYSRLIHLTICSHMPSNSTGWSSREASPAELTTAIRCLKELDLQ